jgi:hypothetical protein
LLTTSVRIKSLTDSVKGNFASADALLALYTEHAPSLSGPPAVRIANAIERDRVQKAARTHAAHIRSKLKAEVRAVKAQFASIESEALSALMLADYIVAKSDDLPASLPADIAAAARTIRGTPEAHMAANQIRLASAAVNEQLKHLGKNYWPKLAAAVTTLTANADLRLFKAADLPDEAAAAERLVIRAKAQSEGVRKQIAAQRTKDNRYV